MVGNEGERSSGVLLLAEMHGKRLLLSLLKCVVVAFVRLLFAPSTLSCRTTVKSTSSLCNIHRLLAMRLCRQAGDPANRMTISDAAESAVRVPGLFCFVLSDKRLADLGRDPTAPPTSIENCHT